MPTRWDPAGKKPGWKDMQKYIADNDGILQVIPAPEGPGAMKKAPVNLSKERQNATLFRTRKA